MKRNEAEEPSKMCLQERSQKRMRSHKSDASSRKRLSYKIDIPLEPTDTTPALQKVGRSSRSVSSTTTKAFPPLSSSVW